MRQGILDAWKVDYSRDNNVLKNRTLEAVKVQR
jgi:hypothetical protein